MTKKSIELFLLPVENDEQKREIYKVIDNHDLKETVEKSFMTLSLLLEEAKEKFYMNRSTRSLDSHREVLSQLITEAIYAWQTEFKRFTYGSVKLPPEAVHEIKVVGEYTFTFEYSPDIQKVLDRDKSAYYILDREFKPTDDIVAAIAIANKILLKKSNFPIHRFKD